MSARTRTYECAEPLAQLTATTWNIGRPVGVGGRYQPANRLCDRIGKLCSKHLSSPEIGTNHWTSVLNSCFLSKKEAQTSLDTEEFSYCPEQTVYSPGKLCSCAAVDGRLMAASPEPVLGACRKPMPSCWAHSRARARVKRIKAGIFEEDWKKTDRLLIAGCDPVPRLFLHKICDAKEY